LGSPQLFSLIASIQIIRQPRNLSEHIKVAHRTKSQQLSGKAVSINLVDTLHLIDWCVFMVLLCHSTETVRLYVP